MAGLDLPELLSGIRISLSTRLPYCSLCNGVHCRYVTNYRIPSMESTVWTDCMRTHRYALCMYNIHICSAQHVLELCSMMKGLVHQCMRKKSKMQMEKYLCTHNAEQVKQGNYFYGRACKIWTKGASDVAHLPLKLHFSCPPCTSQMQGQVRYLREGAIETMLYIVRR